MLSVLTYMDMAAILFNDAELFEQSVNIPLPIVLNTY